MPAYKMIVAYDGTAYSGWQKQPGRRSVEGVLENTFVTVFKTVGDLLGASRTDAGVHAVGQVVRLRTSLILEPDRMMYAFNNSLPEDIIIRRICLAEEAYSPHYNVAVKTYHYHIFTKRPLPFIARYGWYYMRRFSVDLFKEALYYFVGSHDFRSFCSAEDVRCDTVRTIHTVQVVYIARFSVYRVIITGEKFLRHMIRRIIGAAITIATEKSSYTVQDLLYIFNNQNPHHPLPNVPSKGLMLYRITYDGD